VVVCKDDWLMIFRDWKRKSFRIRRLISIRMFCGCAIYAISRVMKRMN
jgi:hypothetical protein